MPSINFLIIEETNLYDGTNLISENSIEWAIFDKDVFDISQISTILDQGTFNVSNGVSTITTAVATGEYMMVINSSIDNKTSAFIVQVTP